MKDIQTGALIGCGDLISTAQPLILPEDTDLIVELWPEELSSPPATAPLSAASTPQRAQPDRGEGLSPATPAPPAWSAALNHPPVPEPGDRRRLRQPLGPTDAGEDVFAWPGKVYDRSEGWENEASVRTDGRRGEDTVAKSSAKAELCTHNYVG